MIEGIINKPTVPEVLPLVRALYVRSATGCCAHILLDDENVGRDNAIFCLNYAEEQKHPDCIELCEKLVLMSPTQHLKIGTLVVEQMTRYYCSVSDKNYLCKLLCLYESILRHSSSPFCLYVLALDESTRIELARLHLEKAIVIECEYFVRQMNLGEIRRSRTHQEWCWTTASQFCEFLLKTGLREVTYLDSDLFMFSDPEAVFNEIGERSIAITPHRLIPPKQHLIENGAFNVGWITFKNTEIGRGCLSRWAAQVRTRCSAETGCGDQVYLNDFVFLYGYDLCILSKGINAGPWSIGNWQVTEGPRLDGEILTAFHFHEFLEREDGTFRLTNYDLRDDDVIYIYRPYVAAYTTAKERIESLHLQRA